jgi:Nuclease-related domain
MNRRTERSGVAALALAVAALAVFALLIVAAAAGWAKKWPEGVVAILALCGLFLMLAIELKRRVWERESPSRGPGSEEAVGAELELLPADKWFVTHDWMNIDHIAVGPNGAFAIEMNRRSLGKDSTKASDGAKELRRVTGISWVTAVVCVPGDDEPVKKQDVWVVPQSHLAQWLQDYREHRGVPVDVYAARVALSG